MESILFLLKLKQKYGNKEKEPATFDTKSDTECWLIKIK